MEHVTGRWGTLVLIALREGPTRFNELRRRVAGVSEKMLAQSLHALERDGFVERTVHSTIPPRVEHALTPLGRQTTDKLSDLVHLLENSMPRIPSRLLGVRAYECANWRLSMFVPIRLVWRLVVRQRLRVSPVGEGEFFCLYCRVDRRYERRAVQKTTYALYVAMRESSVEFVLCDSCGSTFDPECLDESSTAELEELLVDPPWDAVLPAALSRESSGSGPALADFVNGHSPSRRH